MFHIIRNPTLTNYLPCLPPFPSSLLHLYRLPFPALLPGSLDHTLTSCPPHLHPIPILMADHRQSALGLILPPIKAKTTYAPRLQQSGVNLFLSPSLRIYPSYLPVRRGNHQKRPKQGSDCCKAGSFSAAKLPRYLMEVMEAI
jgi:hypothetical protein